MTAGSDTVSKNIAVCLARFYDDSWLSVGLVKACVDRHLPLLFEFLINTYPSLLTMPDDGENLSVREKLAACADFHCYNSIFYSIAKKIEDKYFH